MFRKMSQRLHKDRKQPPPPPGFSPPAYQSLGSVTASEAENDTSEGTQSTVENRQTSRTNPFRAPMGPTPEGRVVDTPGHGADPEVEGILGPNAIVIAVMGVTGSGKSTFIATLTGRPIEIGHGLQSCKKPIPNIIYDPQPLNFGPPCIKGTGEVAVYSYRDEATDRIIYLVDTPGFDDTTRSDTDVLKEVAYFLSVSYSSKIKLSGIIYLHRISDLRMQGSALKNLRMFKKLCGENALPCTILATTMWERVDQETGASRERQLVETENFWGYMVSRGSKVFRHANDRDSALEIVDYIVGLHTKVVLDIQYQMVDQHKTLDQTGAGKELEAELIKQREKFAQQLKEVQEDLKSALEEADEESTRCLNALQKDFEKKLGDSDKDRQRLKTDMERLHGEKEKQLAELRTEMVRQQQANDTKLQQYQTKLDRIQQERDERMNQWKEEKRVLEKARLEEKERYRKERTVATRSRSYETRTTSSNRPSVSRASYSYNSSPAPTQTYYTPAPVYYTPAVYYAPVYYAPQPVVYYNYAPVTNYYYFSNCTFNMR
ncbi:hypothetical protein AA313_de0203902 [Arthrobotrys entomopaga]|nr:hypothetical protein AA313_de0203902 [Arthrobotrys entomopaga]